MSANKFRPTQFDKWGKKEEDYFRGWARKHCASLPSSFQEDVVQIMVLKAWSIYERDDIPNKHLGYIMQSLINVFLIEVRKIKKAPLQIITPSDDVGVNEDDVMDVLATPLAPYLEEGSRIERAIERIEIRLQEVKEQRLKEGKPLQQKVIDGTRMMQMLIEGFTRAEICETFGIPYRNNTRVYQLTRLAARELNITVDTYEDFLV